METVLGQLHQHNLGKEAEGLQSFYESVQRRADGIKTAQGRQTLVVELYDKFFRTAFPTLTKKLGIVYTPVEVVDFIIHSVNDVLQSEFGQSLGSKGVHILDPFTGTGTFITRLLQSGLIKPEELEHKYKHEIHANEIVLLAYYIAAINIEAVYHDMAGADAPYAPFEGICLTDTFQLYEQDHDLVANLLPDNSERRTRQKALDIRVIMGNPPYSAGQKNESDNAKNISYENLDSRIRSTYADRSDSGLQKYLYDSYIRAFRWASDRIGDSGVAAFVSGSAWIERSFADGLRRSLIDDFTSLYVFHLRGDIRKNMLSKGAAREGENVFGSGSMTGISISILVKNPEKTGDGELKFFDIGQDQTQSEKLAAIASIGSVDGITRAARWVEILPDEHGDWLEQRDRSFDQFIAIGEKGNSRGVRIFNNFSLGVVTNRDAWCYNYSKSNLANNVGNTISFYNDEVSRLTDAERENVDKHLTFDKTKIAWTRALKGLAKNARLLEFSESSIAPAKYRPFGKQWMYFNRQLNEMVYQMPRIFPSVELPNRVIAVTGTGARSGFSVLLTDQVPNLHMMDTGQSFPLHLYEPSSADDGLFENGNTGYTVRDGISDAGLQHFQDAYPGEEISKEDLFYYIYGLLHSPEYRTRFKNNLSKELPRIPAVKSVVDFWAFSKAGRDLGYLHVNYETVEPYSVVIKEGDLRLADIPDPESFYRVEKMKFGGKGKDKDKTTVHYNPHITMTEIPLRAYEYVVNGKSALDWVMERQCVKVDKASGITNDANRYANETVGNPAYPLELFQRVITVSLRTLDIVDGLPKLDID
ncbi:MAG TPA: damage-inducible protein, partial [Gammaproteobacteria bacterium]|nr:damage-inducible protein [Gammaproteobacteria bacterium]